MIRSRGDFYFGGFLVAAGVFALYLSRNLPIGSAASMGAGYFPSLLAWSSIGFGALLITRAFILYADPLERASLRPVLLVSLAVAAFMAVEMLGLGIAVIVVTLIGGLGDRETRWAQNLALAVMLGVFSVLLFAVALRIPFPLWPRLPAF